MTRAEHMQWCKDRALEILDRGDLTGAFASMCSDLGKHKETDGHPGIELGTILLTTDNLIDMEMMRSFIEGFS